MKLFISLEAPFEWVRVSGNTVEAFGEVAELDEYPVGDEDELIGVVPGDWVTTHVVNLPAKTKKQFTAAIPYALEDQVSEDIEDLHFHCGNWRAGEDVVVSVIAKHKMREWQQLATNARLGLDRIVPDYSLLPFHSAAECTICLRDSRIVDDKQVIARHINGVGASFDSEFIDIWLSDLAVSDTVAVTDRELAEALIESHPKRDIRLWEVGTRLAHWLEQTDTAAKLDIMGDQYRPKVSNVSFGKFLMPIGLVASAIFLIFLFDTYRYLSLHAEVRSIFDEQAEIVMNVFPQIQTVSDEGARALMTRGLNNNAPVQLQDTPVDMIAAVADVMKQQRVSLTEMSFRDGQLSIICKLNDLTQVDLITKSLNRKPKLSAQLDSSTSEDESIIAIYTLKVAS